MLATMASSWRRSVAARNGVLAAVVAWASLVACSSDGVDPPPFVTEPTEDVCEPGSERSCYSGREGTEGEGACGAGVQRCEPHGKAWGRCQDEQVERQEVCGDDVDDNCDGLVSCGETQWSIRLGGDTSETAIAVAVGEGGDLFVTGYYRAPYDFGDGDLPTVDNSRDVYLMRLSPDGEHIWSRAIFGDNHFSPRNVAVSPDGRVAVVANTNGGVEVDGGDTHPGGGGSDLFVALYDADGTPLFSGVWGDDETQAPSAAAFDVDGNLFVTGFYRGTLDFGDDVSITATDPFYDVFVMKLSNTGELLWVRDFVGSHDDVARDIVLDEERQCIYVLGYIHETTDFGGGVLEDPGGGNVFVLKLDMEGKHVWSQAWGDDAEQWAYSGAVDSQGNLVVTGRYEGTINFGRGLLGELGGGGIHVLKLGPQGETLWSRAIGGLTNQGAHGIAIDSRDRIVVSGYYEGSMQLGETVLPEAGALNPNILAVKLEPDGELVWARGIPVDGSQSAGGVQKAQRDVAIDANDDIIVAGYVVRDVDLGNGLLATAGSSDIFVMKLTP